MRRKKKLLIILVIIGVVIVTPVVLWTIWCWSAERQFQAKLDDLRKRGEPVTLAEMAPPEVAEDQNAALLYERAFALMTPMPDERLQWFRALLRKSEALDAKEIGEAKELLSANGAALALIRQAVGKPQCRFPLSYNSPSEWGMAFKHLAGLQNAGRLLRLSAVVNQTEGRDSEAVRDCLSLLKLSRAVHDEPFTLSLQVELFLSNSALTQLRSVMTARELPEGTCREILDGLRDPSYRARFVRTVKGTRCSSLALLQMHLKDPTTIPLSFEPSGPYVGRVSAVVFKPHFYSQATECLRFLEKNDALAGIPWRQARTGWQQMMDDLGGRPVWRMILISGMVCWVDKLSEGVDLRAAQWECGRTAVALRLFEIRHGEYPDKLGSLVPEFLDKLPVDPFSGKEYVYRKEGKGFILYSLGDNLADDGGVENPRAPETSDIVWKCSR